MEKNYTELFADTLYTLANRKPPENVLAEARKCLLDGLASMLGGADAMRERIEAFLRLQPPCEAGATVVNLQKRASLQNAALCNALSLHAFDMDDGHRFSTVHLAATVIPAVLAVAEYFDLSMEDLLNGILIGYEAGIRMGHCIQPSHRNRGFHATGTVGTLGAAMGVAAALRFSREEFKAALSAAATSAAGLGEAFENVSTMKAFNAARACQDGVTAALIAKSGFVGPYDMLGGTFSFFRAMCESCDPTVLELAADPNWNVTGCYHKIYASCRHTHAPLDGALAIAKEFHPDPKQVKAVRVTMYGQGIKGHSYTDISSTTAGKMSIPYCMGLALVHGAAGISAFTEAAIRDEDVLRICKCTTVEEDPEMTKTVPKKRPAHVTVEMNDGTVYEKQVDYALGEPENPLSMDGFLAKFRDLASYGGKSERENDFLADFILRHEGSVRELTDYLQ